MTSPDGITWQEIWLSQLGAAILSGLVAAGTALLVVHLTAQRAREQARDEEARRYVLDLAAAGHTLADFILRNRGTMTVNELGTAYLAFAYKIEVARGIVRSRDCAFASQITTLEERTEAAAMAFDELESPTETDETDAQRRQRLVHALVEPLSDFIEQLSKWVSTA